MPMLAVRRKTPVTVSLADNMRRSKTLLSLLISFHSCENTSKHDFPTVYIASTISHIFPCTAARGKQFEISTTCAADKGLRFQCLY